MLRRGPPQQLRPAPSSAPLAFRIPPSRSGTLRQVHSATVLEWDEADAIRGSGGKREGDVLWTAHSGTGVGVRTADCVPVLIADPEVPSCAAVHAGWRGFAAGILQETGHPPGRGGGALCARCP